MSTLCCQNLSLIALSYITGISFFLSFFRKYQTNLFLHKWSTKFCQLNLRMIQYRGPVIQLLQLGFQNQISRIQNKDHNSIRKLTVKGRAVILDRKMDGIFRIENHYFLEYSSHLLLISFSKVGLYINGSNKLFCTTMLLIAVSLIPKYLFIALLFYSCMFI